MREFRTFHDTETIRPRFGGIVAGVPHSIGAGFNARHFSEDMFGGAMDPLLMVDHFVMTKPTFDPHLHAGISAVTMLFEDSVGAFLNRDTLGHDIELGAGDLYWLSAARGAAHEEKPAANSRIHALQIFVNLPAEAKQREPHAIEVRAGEVPDIVGRAHRVRVLLGASGDARGRSAGAQDMTMLDGTVGAGGRFMHALPGGQQAWIYAVDGGVSIDVDGQRRVLRPGTATTVEAGPAAEIVFTADAPSHFVLIAGESIREDFVKHGPLVMSTADDVRRTLTDYAAGRFGRIPA